MSRFRLRAAALAAALAFAAPLASAAVLTFDDLGPEGLVPSNYGGLDWSGSTWFHFSGEQAPYTPHSGDGRATVGWEGSNDTSWIGLAAGSTFQGAWFAGFEGVTVTFDLYFQDALVATSQTLGLGDTSRFLSSGYAGFVDRVRVRSNDPAFFAMDDFTFSSPVPEPATGLLLLAGVGIVGAVARRRA